MKKNVAYYMSLPYTMIVKYRAEQGGYYVASYIELPDLSMTGDTPEEAVKELLVEKSEWFETCLKLGIAIPMPVESQEYSGQIRLRIPPSLHQQLRYRAVAEDVSLNQYMTSALASSVGMPIACTKKKRTKKQAKP